MSGDLTVGADEEVAPGYPYCEARPGMEPHNYQPVVDFVIGTGIWLFCTQCGEFFNLDGTASPSLGAPPSPAPSPVASTSNIVNNPTKPPWMP